MTLRLFGLLVGLFFVAWGLWQFRLGRLSRLGLIGSVLLGLGTGVVSLEPASIGFLADLFRLDNRLFALLVATTLVTYVVHFVYAGRFRTLEEQFGGLVRNLARIQSEQAELRHGHHDVIVVMPAYREGESIGSVLDELPGTLNGRHIEVLVVVDGSFDETQAIVQDREHLVAIHPVNRGQGDALRTGFELALALDPDIVMTMDADGQHDPADMAALLEPIWAGEADYVQGSRFLGKYDDQGSIRSHGIRFFSTLLRLFGRVDITDATNGYRAIRSEVLARMEFHEKQFSAAEFILEAARLRLRIREVPVHIRRREIGESRKPRRLRYPLGYLKVVVLTWLRQSRRESI